MTMIKLTKNSVYPVEINELKDMQKEVGGYIESVVFSLNGSRYGMIVDEEGQLKQKDFNWLASILYDDVIVGDALVCKIGCEDFEGFTGGGIDKVLDDIREYISAYGDVIIM